MKYNWNIVGHEKQLEQIEKDISSGNLAHAYLLVGPNSVGKNTVARKMAGILQCENDFCHTCPTCIQVQKGSHIDTIEFKDNKESIKIEDVRNLIERLSMSRQAKYKVVLMQTIERMTIEAANSFLKILEEPPERTIFILSCNNLRALLPTVVSRVRVIKFTTVPHEYLVDKLKEIYPDLDSEVITQASLFSLGKAGKALHLIENPEDFAYYRKVYYDIQHFLAHQNIQEMFSYVEEIAEDKEEYKIDVFLTMLSQILRSKVSEFPENSLKYTNTLSKIEEAVKLLKKNVNTRLVLENLMLAL